MFSYFLLLCWRLLLKGGKEWLSGLGGCTGSHATAAIAIDASFHFVPCRSASSSRSLIPQHTHTHTRACCALQVLSSSLSVSLVSHLCAVLFIIPPHKTQRNKDFMMIIIVFNPESPSTPFPLPVLTHTTHSSKTTPSKENVWQPVRQAVYRQPGLGGLAPQAATRRLLMREVLGSTGGVWLFRLPID